MIADALFTVCVDASPTTWIIVMEDKPAIAQLVEHLTVDSRSNQMVPGSIPGGRTFFE